MNQLSKPNSRTLHLSSKNDQNPFTSNKITMHYNRKLKTQSIEPINHNIQNKVYKKQLKLINTNGINDYDSEFCKKYAMIKPIKSTLQETISKFSLQPDKNITTKQNHQTLYPNLIIKRNGFTAPIRKRVKSQSNKQNINNQEQRFVDKLNCQQKKEDNKQKTMQSVSSILHYKSNSRLEKYSNFVKFKSKPHMVLCCSKLPKDFFGDEVETPVKFNRKLMNSYGNLLIGKNNKQSNLYSSVKVLSQKLNNECLEPLKFFTDVKSSIIKSKNKDQAAFTFRKTFSKKRIDISEQTQNQQKNLEKIVPKYVNSLTQQLNTVVSPCFQTNIEKTSNCLTSQNVSKNLLSFHKPHKKINRKVFQAFLKL